MRSVGIVRKVDELGRIVLPVELRRVLDIEEKDELEIFLDEDTIVLKKHEASCVFCSETQNLVEYRGRNVCKACIHEIKVL